MSQTIRSGTCRRAASKPSSPSTAVIVSCPNARSRYVISSRLARLSSTTSTRAGKVQSSGINSEKVLPTPNSLLNSIRLPSSDASFWLRCKPSPVPSWRRAPVTPTCSKAWNKFFLVFGADTNSGVDHIDRCEPSAIAIGAKLIYCVLQVESHPDP